MLPTMASGDETTPLKMTNNDTVPPPNAPMGQDKRELEKTEMTLRKLKEGMLKIVMKKKPDEKKIKEDDAHKMLMIVFYKFEAAFELWTMCPIREGVSKSYSLNWQNLLQKVKMQCNVIINSRNNVMETFLLY